MNKISAIIVVKDFPPYLEKTIASIIDFVHEIVIVDIGMRDDLMAKLIKIDKVKIKKVKENVPYVELIRNKTKTFATYENILLLDPDEVVQPGLKKFITENFDKYDYLKIPRKNLIFGRWIKHSRWWPDYQVRFFKKDKVSWPQVIHRQPKVLGTGYDIPPQEELAILHYNYEDIDEYLSKARRYAKWEAKEFFDDKKPLTLAETIRRSLNEFFSRYFQAEGYKDGSQGFILAFLQMFYYFLVYFYYLEMNKFKAEANIDTEEFFREGLKASLHYKKNKTIKDLIVKKIC